MNTKKTINVFRGLALIGCFMTIQHTAAQNWPGSQTGPDEGRWILNKNKSNSWAHMRLQVSNDRAWNMINQGDLWWGYAANDTFTDTGTERMRLTTTGKLSLKGDGIGGTIRLTPDSSDGESSIGFYSNPNNTGVYWVVGHNGWSNQGDFTIGSAGTGNSGVKLLIQSDGKVGIGTTSPRGTLDVDGSGHIYLVDDPNTNGDQRIYMPGHIFLAPYGGGDIAYIQARRENNSGSTAMRFRTYNNGVLTEAMHIDQQGNVGIGTTNPQSIMDVNGLLTVRHEGDNSTMEFLAANNKSASIGVQDDGDQGFYILTNGTYRVSVNQNGNVGIGTSIASEKLEVDGTVKATSFTSSANSFPDYVFADDYKMMPLAELEGYVKVNKHLPNMPSEKEVVEQGLNLPEVVTKSVENIETIYLHLIRMEKEIEALKQENTALKQQLKQGR